MQSLAVSLCSGHFHIFKAPARPLFIIIVTRDGHDVIIIVVIIIIIVIVIIIISCGCQDQWTGRQR